MKLTFDSLQIEVVSLESRCQNTFKLTLRATRRASMVLLRPWRSEMCPETAERSFWNVERKDARSVNSPVLV